MYCDLALTQNVPESEFCSICPRKMSFVPEQFSENPRMAPEKYGMYAQVLDTGEWTHKRMDTRKHRSVIPSTMQCTGIINLMQITQFVFDYSSNRAI